MNINSTKIGTALITFSLVLIIVFSIVKVNIDEQEAYLCEITHEEGRPMKACPAHESSNSWLLLIAFGAAFLLLSVGAYLVVVPSAIPVQKTTVQETTSSSKPIDVSKLDQDEKKVYDLLTQNEGSMYQSSLMKETGFSKVKTTRVLDRLETKKILERKRRGMTNLVVLR